MANQYLSTALIQAAKDNALIPVSDQTFTMARLLGIANREVRTYITKLLLSCRESYLETFQDVALVAGQDHYLIPTTAVAAALKQVATLNSSGTPVPLNKIPSERRFDYVNSGGIDAYCLEGNSIVIVPAPAAPISSPGSIRFYFFRRLNRIVADTDCALVTGIAGAAITVALPTTIAGVLGAGGFTGTNVFDFISGTPHFDVTAAGLTATLAGSILTFTTAPPAALAVGDYIALTGTTPIANVPVEVQDLLAQRAVTKALEAQGDPKWQAAKTILDEMRVDILSLLAPRVQGASTLLINYNAPGWGRGLRRGRRRIW